MIAFSTSQLADILSAKLVGAGDIQIDSVNTDTRKYVEKSLFFALKGEKFDAHHYLSEAVKQGAAALVVQQPAPALNVPQLVVDDTRLALGRLGKWLRNKINPRTVAITGSSGKTTVKEMTAAILQHTAKNPAAVLFTQGNFNNDIGVPLTLLRLTERHQFAVIELGANHPGEIDYTTKLVRPDVALINNVAPAHLEGFGSVEGVAKAKGEIFRGLAPNGVAIVNAESPYLPLWQSEIGGRTLQSFNGGNYRAEQMVYSESAVDFRLISPIGEIEISMPYLGDHNVKNALAAAALAINVGASLEDVRAGLAERIKVKGRLYPIQVNEGLLLLDDTYNANVGSLKSAIDVLKNYPAKNGADQNGAIFRILVVGEMRELGADTQIYHQEIADYAKQAKLDFVLSFGTESAVISAAVCGKHFEDKAAMIDYLSAMIKKKQEEKQKVVVLGKGSRSMRMEEVIEGVRDRFTC